MQTALLTLATAIILALVAALVGPFFIDWSNFRSHFEAGASQLTGLKIRINGRIDVRLLPTPTLTLNDIEFGRSAKGGAVHAKSLHVECSLGALMRGKLRVLDAQLKEPELMLRLDDSGHLVWSLPTDLAALEQVSVEQFNVENGRVTLAEGAAGAHLVLENIKFTGALRSLVGPVKGDGDFMAAGHHYPYRISMSRFGDDGRVRLHVNIDPVDQPLTAAVDLQIWTVSHMPRFDGSIELAPSAGAAATSPFNEPLRVKSRIRGDGLEAAFEELEIQYGPTDQSTRFRGNAKLTFGRQPQLSGVLSSPQLDFDRILSLPEESRRRPIVAVKKLIEYFAGSGPLPIPVSLRIEIEALTLGGSTIRRVSGQLKADGAAWEISNLALRAPGLSHMRLSGRIDATSDGVQFKGDANVESGNPKALLGWLTDRVDPKMIAADSFRVSANFSLGSRKIAIDKLNAKIDQTSVLGSFAYFWKHNDRPARLDAKLTTPELDLDVIRLLTEGIAGNTEFDLPQEGALSLKIGRLSVAGVEVKQSNAKLQINSGGLNIEQLAIADLGGMALDVKGRISSVARSPSGAITVNLNARSLDGIAALVEKFAPRAADKFRGLAERVSPLALRGLLSFEPSQAGSTGSNAAAKFQLDGQAGTFQVALQGDSRVASDVFKINDVTTMSAAKVNVSGRLETVEGDALINLIGLDRLIAVDKQPGQLRIAIRGPLDGEMAVEGRLEVGSLSVSSNGTFRISNQVSPTVMLQTKISNANVRSPLPTASKATANLLPLSTSFGLALADDAVRLTNLKGTIAKSTIAGHLTVKTLPKPISFNGEFELSTLDLAAVFGAVVESPTQDASGPATSVWRAAPLAVRDATGQIAVKAGRISLAPNLVARDFRGTFNVAGPQLTWQVLDGRVAGGKITGKLTILRRGAGMDAQTRVKLTDADAAELLPAGSDLSGRFALEISAEGSGLTPVALIGTLKGNGRITLRDGLLRRLNPAAFDAVISAVDRGMPIDRVKVKDMMEPALANGSVPIRRLEAGISIKGGQVRMLSNPVLGTPEVDLVVTERVNLVEGSLDTRLTFSTKRASGVQADIRPEIVVVLKGPIGSPTRTIDVSMFTDWLAKRAIQLQSKKLDVLKSREPTSSVPTTVPIPGSSIPSAPR